MDEAADSATASNIPEYSVSEISGAVKRTLEDAFGRVRVRGEITEMKRYPSGHIYFSLKDEGGKISGIVWKSAVRRLGLVPENGVEVVATGKVTAYGDRSSYQIIVERMEYAGAGAMLARIETLRLKLAAEGLFDAGRKRALPLLPEVIGVVTSERGAVIQDILTTVRRRFPRHVLLWPVPVQGETAAERITAAIQGFPHVRPRPDVLIVARGGGSLEDLMAFNDEFVVRAAAASPITLISAVGHETDTTLIDHAADRRAATPTAAAELAVPSRAQLAVDLQQSAARLGSGVARMLQEDRLALERAARSLPDLPGVLGNARLRVDERDQRLRMALPNLLAARRAALVRAERGMPDLRAIVSGAALRVNDRGERLRLALPNLLAARRAALLRAERGMPDPRAIVSGAGLRVNDRGERLRLALPNLLAARRAALLRAERGIPDPQAIVSGARHRLDNIGALLPAALPHTLAVRRHALALAASHLHSGLRHAVALQSATGGRVLPRLNAALVQGRLRELQVRLHALGQRLESVSHHGVLARGYAAVFDRDGAPVTAARSVRPGSALRIAFADGEVAVRAEGGRASSRQGSLL